MARARAGLTRPESLHEQVATNIRNDIAAGVLRDGQRLPSTRDLADEWEVSVYTINEAMRILADEGLVVNKPRAGRVIHAPDQPQRLDIQIDQQHVLLIGGYAGSGKTELGRILSRETRWPLLDKDSLTRPVVEVALEALQLSPNDRESDNYRTTIRPREYEALMGALVENLECGNSAVVTAPFISEFAEPAWIKRVEAQCNNVGAQLMLIWMNSDADTMHMYLRHRGAARDAVKLNDWAQYLSSIDTSFRPAAPHQVVENSTVSEPLGEQARSILRGLLAAGKAA